MDTNFSQQGYFDLIKELNKAAENYYYAAKSIMTDALYDEKYLQLQSIEKEHPDWVTKESPTQRVGAPIKVAKTFKTGKHSHPMLSLKTETDYTSEGAIAFDKRVKEELGVDKVEYVAEPKFDGLGIDLKYENGSLVQALTRGDGVVGENVTEAVMLIPDIPNQLISVIGTNQVPKLLIVRGEIYLRKDNFKAINAEQLTKGEKLYANPRNTAAGMLRVLYPDFIRMRKLNFFAYTMVQVTNVQINTHRQALSYLEELSFPVCEYTEVHYTPQALADYHDRVATFRDKLPYEIDGVVYKVNNFSLQERLCIVGREPKWAVAHKYPAQERETTVLGIDIQVGRTGKLTPVARLKPVLVGGVTVTNVTLHNEGEARRKDVRVGDTVIVRRAGDVIPEIVGVLEVEPERNRSPIFTMVKQCPICGSDVAKEDDEADYRCTGGLVCPAQRKAAIIHFTQRTAVEVKGLGESLIDQMVETGLVKTIADLYTLTVDDIMKLDRMAFKSAMNIIYAIEASKQTTLRKFLFGLGIRNAGEGTAKRLVEHYKTLDNITNASEEDMLRIKDIGPIVAKNIYNFFHKDHNCKVIEKLREYGIKWDENLGDEATTNLPLNGLNIVLTGSFYSTDRKTAKEHLESLGAHVASSVSKNTNVVVAGPGAGTKLTDANKLGINVVDEQTLIATLKSPELWSTLLLKY